MGHRLSKITTRTGDAGETGLGDGSRVPKDSPRVRALGEELDEGGDQHSEAGGRSGRRRDGNGAPGSIFPEEALQIPYHPFKGLSPNFILRTVKCKAFEFLIQRVKRQTGINPVDTRYFP